MSIETNRMGYQENNFETKNKRFQVSGGKKKREQEQRIESAIIFVDNERLLWALNFLYIAL